MYMTSIYDISSTETLYIFSESEAKGDQQLKWKSNKCFKLKSICTIYIHTRHTFTTVALLKSSYPLKKLKKQQTNAIIIICRRVPTSLDVLVPAPNICKECGENEKVEPHHRAETGELCKVGGGWGLGR